MTDEVDHFDEEDMVRAFARISQSRRGSAIGLIDGSPLALVLSDSLNSSESGENTLEKAEYRLVVMGSSGSGKTAIVSQFLYDTFNDEYTKTVDDMYHGEFDVAGCELTLNIQDTGGDYVDDFPAMVGLSLSSADAVLLVFSVADVKSFENVSRLRELAISKNAKMPIVVVGNQTDLPREVQRGEAEAMVMFEWENGYIECSAKENTGIIEVFQEILHQAKSGFDFRMPIGRTPSPCTPPASMRRRKSLPQIPAFHRIKNGSVTGSRSGGASPSTNSPPSSVATTRRKSFATVKKRSCNTQ